MICSRAYLEQVGGSEDERNSLVTVVLVNEGVALLDAEVHLALQLFRY